MFVYVDESINVKKFTFILIDKYLAEDERRKTTDLPI